MTTMDIDEQFFVTNGSISGDVITYDGTSTWAVKIHSFSIEEDFVKELIDIPIPKPEGDQEDENTLERLLIDILQAKRVINIKGVLVDDSSVSGLDKKNDIIRMATKGGTMSIVWGVDANNKQQKLDGSESGVPTFNKGLAVNIQKMKISESCGGVAKESISTATPYRKWEVNIQFVIGVNK